MQNGSFEVVQLLIDKGANIYDKTLFGETTLDIAKRKQYQDIVEILNQESAKNSSCCILSEIR